LLTGMAGGGVPSRYKPQGSLKPSSVNGLGAFPADEPHEKVRLVSSAAGGGEGGPGARGGKGRKGGDGGGEGAIGGEGDGYFRGGGEEGGQLAVKAAASVPQLMLDVEQKPVDGSKAHAIPDASVAPLHRASSR